MELTSDQFQPEMDKAIRSYNRHIVCIEKTPDEFADAVSRLMAKAIQAYQTRATGLRHGIALDRQLTVILSQAEGDRPFCGIYFNLHSPYQKD